MTGRTVVISGASSGIGFEAARALATAGACTVLLGRDPAKLQGASDRISEASGSEQMAFVADFADFAAVRAVAATVLDTLGSVDVLLNNAGEILSEREVTVDGHERTWQVDYLSQALLTMELAPALAAAPSSRVITVSSDAHLGAWRGLDFDDLEHERGWSSFGAYSAAKLAEIMFTIELSSRWAGMGVTANAVHPGVVRTGFGRGGDWSERRLWDAIVPWSVNAERGADTLVYLASSPEVEGASGLYYYRRAPKRPSAPARDASARRRLWEYTCRTLGRDDEGHPLDTHAGGE